MPTRSLRVRKKKRTFFGRFFRHPGRTGMVVVLLLAVVTSIIVVRNTPVTQPVVKKPVDGTVGSYTLPETDPALNNPVISRSAPAFASRGIASAANDSNYATSWHGSAGSSWLAYDLSSVPAEYRRDLLLVWYSETPLAYDATLVTGRKLARDFPSTYTIETNAAPGGGKAPTDGWTERVTVRGNPYHSRQHVINAEGDNWVRINIRNVQGGSQAQLNMDIYPAEVGLADNWIFYGSSTPSLAMSHIKIGKTPQTFSQLVAAAQPGRFPVQENGSITGINSIDGAKHFDTWLSIFPGRYVYIGLGANDAAECVPPSAYYRNMKSMVDKTLAAGKVPVVPLFNWSRLTTVQRCGPLLIQEIERLYAEYPQIIKGPDFWSFYSSNPKFISSDDIHPTPEGMENYRRMVVQTMLEAIYAQDHSDRGNSASRASHR